MTYELQAWQRATGSIQCVAWHVGYGWRRAVRMALVSGHSRGAIPIRIMNDPLLRGLHK